MAQEYRYPLTRVCLRGGTMTLPRTMVGVFPDAGEVMVVDTATGAEHIVEMSHPRVVAGLGAFFREHGLDVNDELLVAPRDDGAFDLTAVMRPRPGQKAPAAAEAAAAAEPRAEDAGGASGPARAAGASGAGAPAPGSVDEHGADVHGADELDADAPTRLSLDPRAAVAEAESALLELEGGRPPAQGGPAPADAGVAPPHAPPHASQQGSLWSDGVERAPAPQAPRVPEAPAAPSGRDGDQPAPARPPEQAQRASRGAAFEEEDDNEAAMVAVALSSRLRRTFAPLGYRLEPVAAGVLFLHADMGRRRYKVLVQLLRRGERLDWAALLARRRASPADYLAVMGDRADLGRLTSPADLARATLWSWEATERLLELHASVPVTPLDLESHFGRDGLFDAGLKRFEEGVAARVAERGATSEVLSRLARSRAPKVFLLEELAQDVGMSRDAVLRILDRLAEAPLHLVAKVDNGEFLLRQPVDTALAAMASYAESLRQRLPSGRREVFAGLDDEAAAEAHGEAAADDGAAPGDEPPGAAAPAGEGR